MNTKTLAFRLEDIAMGMREALAHAAQQPEQIRLVATIAIVNSYANGVDELAKQLKREARNEAA